MKILNRDLFVRWLAALSMWAATWAAVLVLSVTGAHAGVVFTSLNSFQTSTTGAYPYAGLVQARDGNFYGTTYSGGTNGGYGTVFKLRANGALTSLHSFGLKDGADTYAGLVQGSDGNLYGTTTFGGTNGDYGTVFKISTNGALTSLYSFTGGNDGSGPYAWLVQGSDGNFYSTTYSGGTSGAGSAGYGTVFKISATGVLNTLYSFTDGSDSGNPQLGLVQGSDGNFYGTTEGGISGNGTVFKISTNGVLHTLHSFTGGRDGAGPAGLVQGSDGYFYGTTYSGGNTNLNYPYGYGTVFRISATGVLNTLYFFTGGNAGGNPSGLV
jgi:uncharacterized repeat protein (TIGR03803 family)